MEPPIATADRAGMSASRAATLAITLRSARIAAVSCWNAYGKNSRKCSATRSAIL